MNHRTVSIRSSLADDHIIYEDFGLSENEGIDEDDVNSRIDHKTYSWKSSDVAAN